MYRRQKASASLSNCFQREMADAAVRLISPKISPETWNRLLQPNDGLPLGNDWDQD